MEVTIIAAMAENRAIGKGNALPWAPSAAASASAGANADAKLAAFRKADLGRFKALTMGWPCVMGRKTWESLPRRPLPGRLNVVVSRSMAAAPIRAALGVAQGAEVSRSLPEALRLCGGSAKVFVCGGAEIYREALAVADKIELTLLRRHFDGDAFFPPIDPALWEKTGAEDFDGFSFISYTRAQPKEAK